MIAEKDAGQGSDDELDACVTHTHPIPPDQIARYSPSRDPDEEQDIARYVEIEASDEVVKHVELIKTDYIFDTEYQMWDVTTDKNRWWVITNITNLYSQKHFPSLDYILSFHIGLMTRLKSRSSPTDRGAPNSFDEVFRRHEQAMEQYEQAIEAENFQSIGMLLRECLISLVIAMARQVQIREDLTQPKAADFVGWSQILVDHLCAGSKNKELRQYMKNSAEKTRQLVNWITHDRNANKTAVLIALHGSDMIVGHYISLLMREKTDLDQRCPLCNSRNIRTHFDRNIGADGDYYQTCGRCDWTSHPEQQRAEG